MERAVGRDHSFGAQLNDLLGLDADVGPLQRGVVVVRLQQALAARGVGRGEFGPQFGIGNARDDVLIVGTVIQTFRAALRVIVDRGHEGGDDEALGLARGHRTGGNAER